MAAPILGRFEVQPRLKIFQYYYFYPAEPAVDIEINPIENTIGFGTTFNASGPNYLIPK
jgi:hypothetical protein